MVIAQPSGEVSPPSKAAARKCRAGGTNIILRGLFKQTPLAFGATYLPLNVKRCRNEQWPTREVKFFFFASGFL